MEKKRNLNNGKRQNGKEYNGSKTFEIRDGKGKGREYEDYCYNQLIFEGEYINGEKKGKGKEYAYLSHEYMCFEGEYLNGKRNGKGKEYDYNGSLIFEGAHNGQSVVCSPSGQQGRYSDIH